MTFYSYTASEWRYSTTLALLGVVAMTVFGCAASFCDISLGILEASKDYIDHRSYTAFPDSLSRINVLYNFYDVFNRVLIWVFFLELLTAGGWFAYISGLSEFKQAQSSFKARDLTEDLCSACWFGIIGLGCSCLGIFIGLFGLVLRLAGWVFNLVSLFKFRRAFDQLTTENGWDPPAQRGAGILRTAYTFGIILAFYSIIPVLAVVLARLGYFSETGTIAECFGDGGIGVLRPLLKGSSTIAIFLLILAVAAVLWLFQVCYLISGWYKVKKGYPIDDTALEYEFPSANSVPVTLGAIVAAVIVLGLAGWSCFSPILHENTTASTAGMHKMETVDRKSSRQAPANRHFILPPTGSPHLR